MTPGSRIETDLTTCTVQTLYNAFGGPMEWTMFYVNCVIKGNNSFVKFHGLKNMGPKT